MSIAKFVAMRSKDPNNQVGCCIVSSDSRMLSIGYNGAPNDFSDDNFPCDECVKDVVRSGIKKLYILFQMIIITIVMR